MALKNVTVHLRVFSYELVVNIATRFFASICFSLFLFDGFAYLGYCWLGCGCETRYCVALLALSSLSITLTLRVPLVTIAPFLSSLIETRSPWISTTRRLDPLVAPNSPM